MKRVNVIIALVFVSLFVLPSCEDSFDEIEVNEPTAKKVNDAEQEHRGKF